MELKDLKIDPEFEEKIPPLTDEEFTQLEANILAEGTLISPLITWNGVIVDGHNRYRILRAHPEISFTVREKEFENRYEAIAWICRNQLGRRNLTPEQRRYLFGKQYEAEKNARGFSEKAQCRGEGGKFHRRCQNDTTGSPERTRERIARENGISDTFVVRAEKYAKGIDAAEEVMPGMRNEILSGAIKPTVTEVAAIARAAPEERKELAELLRQPRPSPKKRGKQKESSTEAADGGEADTFADDDSQPTALAISERMASSPEREKREASVHSIIVELTDALESMMFRWDFQFSENSANLVHADCQQSIRELAARGIEYLKSHQGGNKDAGNDT